MANKIILKKSSVAAKVPTSTDLEVGEIAVNLVDQKLYSKKADGTVVLVGSGVSGGGDVTGAASSTDNAVARFNGTTGKSIQNSSVIIDDSNNVTGVATLNAANLIIADNSTLGASNTDTVAVNARITTDLEPNTNNAKDVGTSGRNWRDGFFGRNLTAATLNATTVDINGGTIDGATIGGASAAAGTFTSITDSGNLNFTGTGNRITGDTANATVTNRLALQDSTTNAQTIFSVFPNGTSTQSQIQLYNSSSGTNYTRFNLTSFPTSVALTQTIAGTGTYLPMTFFTSASEAMRLDTSGNVGIGTSSPSGKLQINAQDGFIFNAASAISTMRFGSAGSGEGTGELAFDRGAGAITFKSGSTGSALTERMRIDSSGNVGIGTSSPSGKFNVGSGRSFFGANSETYSIGLGYTQARVSSGQTYYIGATDSATPDLVFSNAAGIERMRLDTSGNVGIGTSSPSSRFAVVDPVGSATSISFLGSPDANTTNWRHQLDNSGFNGRLRIRDSANTETVRLNSSGDSYLNGGNVGIGTISGNTKFTVQGAAAYGIARFTTSDYSDGVSGSGILINTGATTGNTFTSINAYQAGFASSNNLILQNSGGNVGIGTSSPSAKLDVQGSVGTSTPLLVLKNTSTASASNIVQSQFFTGNSFGGLEQVASITGSNPNAGVNNGGALYFSTSANGTATTPTERMRIDSSGNLLVGTSSNDPTTPHREYVVASNNVFGINASGGGTAENMRFYNAGTAVGTIQTTATTTTYNTSSDYRLKEITGSITTSGAYIDSLNPVEGTWKTDGSTFVGLIAHEVQEVSRTDVATGVKDGEEMQSMDYSNAELIANLIAEVKSLRQRLASAGI
jgi:hypothetical protein